MFNVTLWGSEFLASPLAVAVRGDRQASFLLRKAARHLIEGADIPGSLRGSLRGSLQGPARGDAVTGEQTPPSLYQGDASEHGRGRDFLASFAEPPGGEPPRDGRRSGSPAPGAGSCGVEDADAGSLIDLGATVAEVVSRHGAELELCAPVSPAGRPGRVPGVPGREAGGAAARKGPLGGDDLPYDGILLAEGSSSAGQPTAAMERFEHELRRALRAQQRQRATQEDEVVEAEGGQATKKCPSSPASRPGSRPASSPSTRVASPRGALEDLENLEELDSADPTRTACWQCDGSSNWDLVSRLQKAGAFRSPKVGLALLALDRAHFCRFPE